MMRLELSFPTKPYVRTQNYGGNNVCCEDKPGTPIVRRKIAGALNGICPVGYVKLYPLLGMKGHTGIDSVPGNGTPLFHAGPEGTVEEISTEPERGLGIGIVSLNKYEMDIYGSHYVKLRYWHLERFTVKMGDIVKGGDLIGYCDSTGISGGPHLHFELKPVEPALGGSFTNVQQDNGYYGSIDPAPFYGKYHAQDFPQIIATLNAIIELYKRIIALIRQNKGRDSI